MKNIFVQFLGIVVLFFTIWFSLSKIDWVNIFRIEEKVDSTEKLIGEMVWESYSNNDIEVFSDDIIKPIDSLVNYICYNNSIDSKKIKIHILHNDQINAFALPDRYLVIFTGLIEECENEAELLGVIGHELAHIQENHVMKKLLKEVGLSVLISMTTSSKNGKVIKDITKILSSSAYERSLEKEADMISVDYLLNANIDPEPYANLLYRLSSKIDNLPDQVYWITSHPESKERAKNIINHIENKTRSYKPVLSSEKWSVLKNEIESL